LGQIKKFHAYGQAQALFCKCLMHFSKFPIIEKIKDEFDEIPNICANLRCICANFRYIWANFHFI